MRSQCVLSGWRHQRRDSSGVYWIQQGSNGVGIAHASVFGVVTTKIAVNRVVMTRRGKYCFGGKRRQGTWMARGTFLRCWTKSDARLSSIVQVMERGRAAAAPAARRVATDEDSLSGYIRVGVWTQTSGVGESCSVQHTDSHEQYIG